MAKIPLTLRPLYYKGRNVSIHFLSLFTKIILLQEEFVNTLIIRAVMYQYSNFHFTLKQYSRRKNSPTARRQLLPPIAAALSIDPARCSVRWERGNVVADGRAPAHRGEQHQATAIRSPQREDGAVPAGAASRATVP